MDIRQLRYFKEIVDQGSISKAAAVLHMAQPPLSMLLKQLEERFGLPLIKRYREKWEVTEAGQVLYNHAVQMLLDLELIDVKMNYLRQGEEGRVRVGISSSCLHMIGPVIKSFTERYPKAQLHLTKGDSTHLEGLLFANELDVAIILTPENTEMYEMHRLPSSPFALAIPEKWYEEIAAAPFDVQKFADYPFVLLEVMEGYSMLEEIQAYFKKEKLTIRVVAECKDIVLVRELVASEVGISILPIIDDVTFNGIRYQELPQLTTKIQPVLLYKHEVELSPICMKFIALFHDI